MASRRSTDSPSPWPQYEVRTTFLRVPTIDWAAVKLGIKTEFRATGRAATQLWNVTTPCPVVGYRVSKGAGHDSRLLVLESTWSEPLGAISPESLAREGVSSLAEFRSYWSRRTEHRFPPLQTVQVYRVRPLLTDDRVPLACGLLEKLYRGHL